MLLDNQFSSSSPEATGLTTSFTRRKMVKRLGMVAAAGTLAAAASPVFALADDDNRFTDLSADHKPSGINVLLVHGVFADASSWRRVTNSL